MQYKELYSNYYLSHYKYFTKSIGLYSFKDILTMLGMIMMVGYPLFLRRIFWFVRLAVLLALLLPGSIPTMLLLLAKYTLDVVDTDGIIISFISDLIKDIFELLPPFVQTLIIPILVLVVVTGYLVAIKLLNPEEPLIVTIKKQRDAAYHKFVKIPSK